MCIVLYLDNAATTRRKPAAVYREMFRQMLRCGNAGRGGNKLSLGSAQTIVKAQEAVAELFGIDNESNIVFTQNATYALNMAIYGVMSDGGRMVVTEMEHNSVLRPAAMVGNYSVSTADKYGYVSPYSVRKRITGDTRLVVCTHVSNVCGAIEPVSDIANTVHSYGALFLTDCSQSAGGIDIKVKSMGADIIACAGHKGLMGPMGTGILYIRDPSKVRAVIAGGTGSDSESIIQPEDMPDKFHCGTMNIPAIAGLTEGVRFVIREGADNIGRYEKMLADHFRAELMNMDNITLYGKGDTGIVAFNIGDLSSIEVSELMDDDIIIRAGYHCAPFAHKALGTSDRGAVRVSFGYFNSMKDVKRITDEIYKIERNI